MSRDGYTNLKANEMGLYSGPRLETKLLARSEGRANSPSSKKTQRSWSTMRKSRKPWSGKSSRNGVKSLQADVQCAACDFDALAVLDAAHVFPKQKCGTDDPRNGLVFCASHHRAFDAGLLPSTRIPFASSARLRPNF